MVGFCQWYTVKVDAHVIVAKNIKMIERSITGRMPPTRITNANK